MTGRRRFCFATMMLSLVIPAPSFGDSAFADNSFADNEVPASYPVTLPSQPAFIPPEPQAAGSSAGSSRRTTSPPSG
jgi:hypothetical protein